LWYSSKSTVCVSAKQNTKRMTACMQLMFSLLLSLVDMQAIPVRRTDNLVTPNLKLNNLSFFINSIGKACNDRMCLLTHMLHSAWRSWNHMESHSCQLFSHQHSWQSLWELWDQCYCTWNECVSLILNYISSLINIVLCLIVHFVFSLVGFYRI